MPVGTVCRYLLSFINPALFVFRHIVSPFLGFQFIIVSIAVLPSSVVQLIGLKHNISKTTKNFLPFWAFPLADKLTSCSQVCRFPKCQDSEAMWGLQLGA